jgi:hypothetical protein
MSGGTRLERKICCFFEFVFLLKKRQSQQYEPLIVAQKLKRRKREGE